MAADSLRLAISLGEGICNLAGRSGLDVDIHTWIDITSIVGLLAATFGGVLLTYRLAQHKALEDKVNQHDSRLAAIEAALEWIRKLFVKP